MSLSVEDRISVTFASFLKKQVVLKLLVLFVLCLSSLSSVIAAPVDSEVVGLLDSQKGEVAAIKQRELPRSHNAILVGKSDVSVANPGRNLQKRQAGLFWGPVYIGNLKLYLTNPHDGYAGPKFPNANHVNFHVDKQAPRNSYTEVVNLHIVKYTSQGKSCLYAWDSVTKKTVFDNCFDDFSTAIAAGVSAAKKFVDALLQAADFIAAIAIIAALAIALAAALASLGAVALA